MRIALLSNHLNPGGITTYVLDVYRGLTERGYELIIFSSAQADLDIRQAILPVRGKNAFAISNLRCAWLLKELVQRYKVDLLWAHTRITSVLSAIVSSWLKIPYIVTLHGFYTPNVGRLLFPCQGERTIAISRTVKSYAVEKLKMDPDKIKVVYNAIAPQRIKRLRAKIAQVQEMAKQLIGLPQDSFVIGMRCRLSSVKGYDIAINLMDRLPSYVYLVLATYGGDRKERKRFNDLIAQSVARNRILWYDTDLADFLFWAAIDIFLMPSYQEGFGLAALEALELGIPVVASNVGGLREVIRQGHSGFLFEVGNIEDCLGKIMKFLNEPDIMVSLKKLIPEAISSFSFSQFLDSIESVIREVMG